MSETLNALRELLSTIFEFAVQKVTPEVNNSGGEMIVTIVAGVLVFVACEWLKEVWLFPLQEYKKLKSRISKLLVMHAQYYANPITADSQMTEKYLHASCEIRELASDVSAFAEIIPWLHLGIPRPNDIVEAGKNLIGLSNGFFIGDGESTFNASKCNVEYCKNVKKFLKFRGMSKKIVIIVPNYSGTLCEKTLLSIWKRRVTFIPSSSYTYKPSVCSARTPLPVRSHSSARSSGLDNAARR